MNAEDAKKHGHDINYYWTGPEIKDMNKNELLEYADYLGSLSNETFKESSFRFRVDDDPERALIFDEMEDRWDVIEEEEHNNG